MTEQPIDAEVTEVVHVSNPASLVTADAVASFDATEALVRKMADKTGPQFISNIQGRMYPKVEWWTTVGLALGLSPVEVSSERVEEDGNNYHYLAKVEVRRGDQVVTSASAICSTKERAWGNRDEYAVKSMATTRATGKAYRIGLSALAVMAGLEPTPADEIPPQGFGGEDKGHGICPEHGAPFLQSDKQRDAGYPPSHKQGAGWCTKTDTNAVQQPRRAQAKPREVSPQATTARDALDELIGSDARARADFIKAAIERDVNHPDEVTDDEWAVVAEKAKTAIAERDNAEMDAEFEEAIDDEDVEELSF